MLQRPAVTKHLMWKLLTQASLQK